MSMIIPVIAVALLIFLGGACIFHCLQSFISRATSSMVDSQYVLLHLVYHNVVYADVLFSPGIQMFERMFKRVACGEKKY